MLKQRVISAAILLPVVIALFVVGGWAYSALVVVATLVASLEYVRMFRRKGYRISVVLVGLACLAWEAGGLWPQLGLSAQFVTLVVLATTVWELLQARADPQRLNPTEQWAMTLAGGTYLGLGGMYLVRLRAMSDGLWWTLSACLIVWIGDSAAYFAGRRWGRHKMAPTISPGKSWEGYAAQVASGLVSGIALGWLWPALGVQVSTITIWRGLLLGGVVSVLCPAGDFIVSLMKREVGVKDTSTLIPGHGGIFDRIDSLLWAGMLGYLLIQLFASPV